jgi:membrane-bound lytic murein transglycosylase F
LGILGLILVICAPVWFPACSRPPRHVTLQKILQEGKLTVITRNNANCYYVYRDEPMGFEYELAKEFAAYLGVKLQIKISEKWKRMIPDLINGSGAIVAASMTATPKRRKQVVFSDAYMKIQQYIIVHRRNSNIDSIEELEGPLVHIRRGTSYQERLEELIGEGIKIRLNLVDDVATEELIRQVAQEEIDITIADNNIALINRRYYPQISMTAPINDKEYLAWAVNPKSTQLLARINAFFRTIRANGKFAEIYNRYYADVGEFDFVDLRSYHRRLKSRLPKYEPIIRQSAEEHGFDWRLIAAQIYQESHFRTWARSHAGAYGLMQLTRSTAKSLGVKDIYLPEENIPAGVRHLKYLYDRYGSFQKDDRLKVALAAYNIGTGHVGDAMQLAREMNLDPYRWTSIKTILPLLRKKKYYQKTNYGYCRGDEPIRYVKQIMIYYDILKRQAVETGHKQHH